MCGRQAGNPGPTVFGTRSWGSVWHIDIIFRWHHDVIVRTTIALDDDLAEKLRQMAHKRRISFRRVVDEVLRRGLNAQEPARSVTPTYRVETFESPFRAGVDPLRLNQLVDDLEIDRSGRTAR